MPSKRVNIDDETWAMLDLLARDRMATFQELVDEAFTDLLKKHTPGHWTKHRIGSNEHFDRGSDRLRCCNMKCWRMSQMGH
jgi:hypothetical protein